MERRRKEEEEKRRIEGVGTVVSELAWPSAASRYCPPLFLPWTGSENLRDAQAVRI